MYKDPASKLMVCAFIIAAVGALASFIWALFVLSENLPQGILIMIVGFALSYILSLLIYAFGLCMLALEQTAKAVDDIHRKLCEEQSKIDGKTEAD